MKRRLECPAELFVPLALLIPALAGQAGTVAAVAAACALGRLCTSCAAEAFRCAAAQEISPQRVRGAWSGALLATLTLSVAALSYVPRAWVWLLAKPLAQGAWLALWGIGTCLPIARLADGHLRAVGEGGTAALSTFLRAILLAAGAFCGLQWAAGAAAVAAAVALVLACRRRQPAGKAKCRGHCLRAYSHVAGAVLSPARAAVGGGLLAPGRRLGGGGVPAGHGGLHLRCHAIPASGTRECFPAHGACSPRRHSLRGRTVYARAGARRSGAHGIRGAHGAGRLRRGGAADTCHRHTVGHRRPSAMAAASA